MTLSHRLSFAGVIAACLSAFAVPAAFAAAQHTVRAVRFWTAEDHTRVVIDVSAESRYLVRALSDPARIVIDIPSCLISRSVKALSVRDGVLDRVRVNRLKTDAQIVLDLPRAASFSHFPLKASEGKPNRIVVDVARVNSGTGSQGNGGVGTPPETGAAERRRIPQPEKSGDFLVVIDAGHGGRAPGTVSRSGLQEKVPALKLAKRLKAEIERYPGCRALLTREGDGDVDLYRRVMLARESGGDVFVSLHFDSHPDRAVRGITLYFLSVDGASDESAAAAAERENLLLEAGADSAGFNDDLKSILFDVSYSNTIYRSSLLADAVASKLRRNPRIPFRKTKQALFVVLKGIAMPSILVEGGYLSNRKDADFIGKDSYLDWLAKSLAEGIIEFLKEDPRPETVDGT
jgi:N-acetylmuramoyl-L-alanine amidase